MSYHHLYRPEPCEAWPVHELRAVGLAYRDAAGSGLDGQACLDRTIAAYVKAGGGREGAERAVRDMIASLSHEHGDWLWGPAQALRERHPPSPTQIDLFERPEDVA